MGVRGQRLSGGEISRIALAHVFLRPTEMAVFDESAADPDNGRARPITELLGGDRIFVIIARRPESLRDCDRILTPDGGRILTPDGGRIVEATPTAVARRGLGAMIDLVSLCSACSAALGAGWRSASSWRLV